MSALIFSLALMPWENASYYEKYMVVIYRTCVSSLEPGDAGPTRELCLPRLVLPTAPGGSRTCRVPHRRYAAEAGRKTKPTFIKKKKNKKKKKFEIGNIVPILITVLKKYILKSVIPFQSWSGN